MATTWLSVLSGKTVGQLKLVLLRSGNGTTGVSGIVSAANSLVGSTTDDYVGYNDDGISAVTALSNGNYVVSSPEWGQRSKN